MRSTDAKRLHALGKICQIFAKLGELRGYQIAPGLTVDPATPTQLFAVSDSAFFASRAL